jgi:hypothetical protein
MVACSIVALILFMAASSFVRDIRLGKKVDLIERLCAGLNGQSEKRLLLNLPEGRRHELLPCAAIPLDVPHTVRVRQVSEPGSDLQLLQFLNSMDTESRGGKTKGEPVLNAA